MAFLTRMFVNGDMGGAYEHFAAPDFVQHNPEIGDGVAAHRTFFDRKARRGSVLSRWANVDNILLVDGDLFALHHQLFVGPNDPGRVFVDIWRVANGRIVEHWDVIQPRPQAMAHNNGMGCGKGEDYASARAAGSTIAAPACGLPDRTADRLASLRVVSDYALALRGGDVAAAISRWLTPDYRQHSPEIGDGPAGALAYLGREFGKGRTTMPLMGPMRTIAEGDYVLQHRLTYYPAKGLRTANVDIFRVRDGRISEHWDLRQPVPRETANRHEMW